MVVTDTNESVDDDDVSEDVAEFDGDDDVVGELSERLFIPEWPSLCKTALMSLPPVSLSSTCI